MPNPFWNGDSCTARRMAEIETRRYSAVRAAGWTFDHEAGVWRHAHTGRTGLNQHVIHECLRDHSAMPPCGNRRDETPYDVRRQWIERASRLREIEAIALRSPQVQPRYILGPMPRDWVARASETHITESQLAREANWQVVAAAARLRDAALQRAARPAPARPQMTAGKEPITDHHWQA